MRSQRGMTLVEVVVAATLFAAIMLATTTGLRTFARTYESLSAETSMSSRVREVDRFLRATLRDAVNLNDQFDGNGSAVKWVAPIDRVGSAGGLQHLQLRVSNSALVLSFAPMDYRSGAKAEPRWGSAVSDYILHDDVISLRVSYRTTGDADWTTSSKNTDDQASTQLPFLVRLEVETSDGEWPPITVALDQHGAGS